MLAFIYICAFTLYFIWGFAKIPGLYLIFVDVKLYSRQIITAIACLISAFAIDYFLPKSVKQYAIASLLISLAIQLLIVLKSMNIRKHELGELIFKSEQLSRTIYFIIPFSLIVLWAFNRALNKLSNQTIYSTTDIGGIEVNSYLWFACWLSVLISNTIFCFAISWNRLEIRDEGIWYISELVWEDIVDYSWEENQKYNSLLVTHINGFGNEIKSKYPIEKKEREIVDKIINDKTKNKLASN